MKWFALLGLLLFLGVAVAPIISAINTTPRQTLSKRAILYVGGSGAGNYTRIQDAIDNASAGDTVFVFVRTCPYFENIIVSKRITLIGEDKNATVIDGDFFSDIVRISADNVVFSDFTLLHSGGGSSGIEIVEADSVEISDVIITSTYEECIRLTLAQNCVITHNQFVFNDGRGILLDSSNHASIASNIFSKNCNDGIAVLYSSSNNNISHNIFTDSLGGIWLDGPCATNTMSANMIQNHSSFGIWSCTSTNNNTIKDNVINDTVNGIILNNTRDNTVQGNKITNVSTGMHLCYARYNHILENYLSHADIGVECCVSSDNNLIYHNNFYDNSVHAYDDSSNTWDDGYPSGGNYWDDYNGTDENGDGIGDSPYFIPGGCNEDRYPLMQPWFGNNHVPEAPCITGKSKGKAGVTYDYSFLAIDLDDDMIFLWVDWGDDSPAVEWIGPYTSAETIILSHAFEEKGDYTVSAKVKDEYDAESEWGTLEVSMPLTYQHPALHWIQEHSSLLARLHNLLGCLE